MLQTRFNVKQIMFNSNRDSPNYGPHVNSVHYELACGADQVAYTPHKPLPEGEYYRHTYVYHVSDERVRYPGMRVFKGLHV